MSTYETFIPQKVFLASSLRFSKSRMFDGVQMKKVRCGPVAGDLQLYDCGSLSIATNNCADTSAIGDVWVSYEIELISPQTEPATPLSSKVAIFNLSGDMALVSTVAKVLAVDEEVVNGLGVTNAAGVLTLPCGTFRVKCEVTLTDSSSEAFLGVVYLEKDSGLTSPLCKSSTKNSVGVSIYISCETYIVSDGTTTVDAKLTATGSAGSLAAAQDQCRVIIEVV
jgi:hypothetical protein